MLLESLPWTTSVNKLRLNVIRKRHVANHCGRLEVPHAEMAIRFTHDGIFFKLSCYF